MINDISQNVVGLVTPKTGIGSDSVSGVAQKPAVEATNMPASVKQKQTDQTELRQPVEVNQKELEEVVDDLNDYTQMVQRQLEFSVDQDSGKTIIRVIDAETGETIRDIPPEEIINMQKQLKEMSEQMFSREEANVSLLFNSKV